MYYGLIYFHLVQFFLWNNKKRCFTGPQLSTCINIYPHTELNACITYDCFYFAKSIFYKICHK